jgi:hypothetical protein
VDHQKLDWINKHHILKRAETKQGLDSLVEILKPFVYQIYEKNLKGTNQEYKLENDYLSKVINTIKVKWRQRKKDKHVFNIFHLFHPGTN